MTALTLQTAHLTATSDSKTMALKSATLFCYYIREAVKIAGDRRLRVCLSGGSTPFSLYALLTQSPWHEGVPWQKIDFFMGDERFVPIEDAQSNFGRIKSTLFDKIDIAPSQIFPIPTAHTLTQAASNYQKTLQTCYGSSELLREKPFFDLTLLGMGSDGHTASLFPHDSATLIKDKWVYPAQAPQAPKQRITLTFPILNSSRFIMFMINGDAKRDILAKIRGGDKTYPASQIRAVRDMTLVSDQQTLQTQE